MNAADLERLELAKRAFKATQPGDAEVQTGVRRARLSLDRPKRRRAWFSKGLVFVVLAVGSLAYAKPQALGELVEKVLPHEAASSGKSAGRGAATDALSAALTLGGVAPAGGVAPVRAKAASVEQVIGAPASAGDLVATAPALSEANRPNLAPKSNVTAPKIDVTATAPKAEAAALKTDAQVRTSRTAPAPAATPTSEQVDITTTHAVSDWGRVGQALARGDDNQALAALDGLSESDDQRTRDKADLGRAQLLMAHGNPDKACALARALTHRRAGGRIERQAQLLLKSCTR
jgi:hypothetical protein